MSTQPAAASTKRETLNDAVSRRLRGLLAEHRVSATSIAQDIGMTQAAISRRMIGMTEWTLNELDSVCRATGIAMQYLLTGSPELLLRPALGAVPDASSPFAESNRRPSHYE